MTQHDALSGRKCVKRGSPTCTSCKQHPAVRDIKTWSAGVNWWMTEYMRLMFQYSESDLSGYPTVVALSNPTLPPHQTNGFDGATMRGFGMRMQVDW
jgi:phosphate-selective porin